MSPEIQALVEAITSLKQPSSILKNYLLPFMPAVIATLGGFFIASYNFKRQESVKADAKKLEDTNKFIVQVDSALQSLMSAKSHYQDHITEHPFDRAFNIGSINSHFSNLGGVENLVFLAKGNKIKEGQPYYVTWNNIPRINAMVGNYSYLKEKVLFKKKLQEQLEMHLDTESDGGLSIDFGNIKPEALTVIRKFVNETEGILGLIDGLILEFNSFLIGITNAIEDAIDTKRIKHLVTLIKYDNNNPMIQRLLEPVVRPDFTKLAEILGQDEESIRQAFETGYF